LSREHAFTSFVQYMQECTAALLIDIQFLLGVNMKRWARGGRVKGERERERERSFIENQQQVTEGR
jgi:hypothetical protein